MMIPKRLSKGQRAARAAFAALLTRPAEADAIYDALPGSWNGRIISSDLARFIDLALAHGWLVEIAYVFRDIELALYGAVGRARQEGRSVPLAELAGNHRAVQQSILKLIRHYAATEQVQFFLIHNTGTEGVTGKSLQLTYRDLAPAGALHYSQSYERYYTKAAQEIQMLNPAKGED